MSAYGSVFRKDNQPGFSDAIESVVPNGGCNSASQIEQETDIDILRRVLSRSAGIFPADGLARNLIARFGGFGAVLAASPNRLSSEGGLSTETVSDLKLIEAAVGRLARAQVLGKEVIASWDALLAYCRITMAHCEIEQFRVLFLDRKNKLIADELLQSGTIDHVPVYPRQVAKRALEQSASALILVHNHPSGDATPSQSDIDMTRRVAAALEVLDIRLHDHVIVSREADFSFRAQGLL